MANDRYHQNMDAVNRIIARRGVPLLGAFYLGQLCVKAEENQIILDEAVMEQIVNANDLNDATGYFAVWLGKRVEAAGGKVTDF